MYWIVDIKSDVVALRIGSVVKFSVTKEEDGKVSCALISKDAKLVWDEWTFINAISCNMIKSRRTYGYIIEDHVMSVEDAEEYCNKIFGSADYLKTLPVLINLL